MAITLQNMVQSKIISSLDTYNYTILTSAMHVIDVQLSEIPPSGLSLLIKQNGVTKFTSLTPAAAQQLISSRIVLNCAANDIIAIVISSSSAVEAGPNRFKGLINIHVGSN